MTIRSFIAGLAFCLAASLLNTVEVYALQSKSQIANLASDDCTLFMAWTGELKADKNGNASEKWLAQDEIQSSLTILQKSIDRFLNANPVSTRDQ